MVKEVLTLSVIRELSPNFISVDTYEWNIAHDSPSNLELDQRTGSESVGECPAVQFAYRTKQERSSGFDCADRAGSQI